MREWPYGETTGVYPAGGGPVCAGHRNGILVERGFAPSQKQKNIRALHGAFLAAHPDARVLEISSKSMQENGPALSAFALAKYVPALGKSVPVENVFQAGKVFEGGGRRKVCVPAPSGTSEKAIFL